VSKMRSRKVPIWTKKKLELRSSLKRLRNG
jgi:hypothetical protein